MSKCIVDKNKIRKVKRLANSNEKEKDNGNFMIKIATFIVDRRNLFFLLFGIAIIFSLVSMNWVSVENAMSASLGVGSPLGWLCTITKDAALYLNAFINISLGDIAEQLTVPLDIIKLRMKHFLVSSSIICTSSSDSTLMDCI